MQILSLIQSGNTLLADSVSHPIGEHLTSRFCLSSNRGPAYPSKRNELTNIDVYLRLSWNSFLGSFFLLQSALDHIGLPPLPLEFKVCNESILLYFTKLARKIAVLGSFSRNYTVSQVCFAKQTNVRNFRRFDLLVKPHNR